jgi:pyruvate-ferredoxin/flavodoxin oxidoreductase
MKKINKITGKDYKPFNYYGSKTAKKVIVAMGSVCGTIKEVVDYLTKKDEEVGLIEVHLYRPFSSKYLLDVLPETVKDIAVIDRTKEHGSNGEPLYLDIVNFVKSNNLNINVIGGRYGLSSRNTTPEDIKSIYDNLSKRDRINNFTIGIIDDVTNLSLPKSNFSLDKNGYEMLIYGFGSDGMVSASKDIIKIVGTGTKAYVQGYFEYDSRKSGGLTKSHLRFRNEPIRSTYYVERPDLIVCTKDSYLLKYDILSNIMENGIFILNTTRDKKELMSFLPDKVRNTIVDKKVKFYIINAYDIAKSVGLDNKISSIMETVIFRITNLIDKEYAIREIKKSLTKRFENRGNNVLEKNLEAIAKTARELSLIELDPVDYLEDVTVLPKTLFQMLDTKEGYNLKVSDFEKMSDGVFLAGTTRYENHNVSETVPHFIKENCIMCNLCSFVCPHAVIRPFLLDEKETNEASETIKENLLDSNLKDLKYTIGVNVPNCTGCKLCVNICPGKKGEKALVMKDAKDEDGNDYKYLFDNVTEKKAFPRNTVKGSQFIKPRFEFSGACAGCGETPYLKLLTQLFGEKLIIANATGCSSIYGGSVPSIPYSVPWANSLFEDNAEFGYGMVIADNVMKNRIKSILRRKLPKVGEHKSKIFNDYLTLTNDENSNKLYEYVKEGKEEDLIPLLDYIKTKSFWIVGGDGWAYDIGFSGIDHILSKHENVNILVLDTEVYSNTGGQCSKSSPTGSVNNFSFTGKITAKKDLARIALTYPHVYVGTISLGASFNQTVQTLVEAEKYNGPSIIIAYSPCIEQSILKGMSNSIEEEKLATESGYFPIFRYNPETKKFTLDSEADFCKYFDFLNGEDRYRRLKEINPDKYKELFEQNRNEAIERYNYYSELSKKENK